MYMYLSRTSPLDERNRENKEHVEIEREHFLVFVSTPLGRLEFRNAKEPVLQLRPAATVPDWEPKKSVNFWDENMSICRSSNNWKYSS